MAKSDKWIKRMAIEKKMIEPFEPEQVRKGISYGTSSNCGCAYEIILADDASSDLPLRYHNSLLTQQENVSYIQHEANIGRSKTCSSSTAMRG